MEQLSKPNIDLNHFEIDKMNQNVYNNINYENKPTSDFVLKYYQVLPKYYMMDNNLNVLICNYGLGSGKTAVAVYIVLEYLNRMNKIRLLSGCSTIQTRSTLSNQLLNPDMLNKIYIIGSWVTLEAFQADLLRPEFGLVDFDTADRIKSNLSSTDEDLNRAGQDELRAVQRKLYRNFIFRNFQTLFNLLFPDLDERQYSQDITELIEAYRSNTLTLSESFLKSLANTIVVIDEAQHMWNRNGMNTYGFTISMLVKNSKKYNIKFVLLSGTLLNTSTSEIVYMMSVLHPTTFIDESKYIKNTIEANNNTVKRLNPKYIPDVIKFFKNNYIYYSQTENSTTKFKHITDKHLSDNGKFTEEMIIDYNNSDLPIIHHIGNKVIKKGFNMVLYELENINNKPGKAKNIDGELVDLRRDCNFPNDTFKVNGVYTGENLVYKNLVKYSVTGAEMVRLCLKNNLNNEKVICYHERVNNSGLLQYAEFLKMNGYIEYQHEISSKTRCKICGLELSQHVKQSHSFKPLVYALLYGELSDNTRRHLTQAYNNYKNLYGDEISVMLVSSIASAGLNLFHTTNLIILSSISGISKYKQICGRVVRTASHVLLPENMRLVKIYTFALPNEVEYYKLKCQLYEECNNLINTIAENSITKDLFNNKLRVKSNYTVTEFNKDLQNNLNIILQKLFHTKVVNTWSEDDIIKYIKTTPNISHFDYSKIPSEEIILQMLKLNLQMFKFENNDTIFYKTHSIEGNNNICAPFEYFESISGPRSTAKKDLETFLNQETLNKTGIIGVRNKITSYLRTQKQPIEFMKHFLGNEFFLDVIYKIHNEYYDNDENNFVFNHSSKQRNRKKMTGFYFKDMIVKLDGEIIPINTIRNNVDELDKKDPKINWGCGLMFVLRPDETPSILNWYLHVSVITISEQEFIDKRKMSTGANCIAFDTNKLIEAMNKLDIKPTSEFKHVLCLNLIEQLCDYCIKNKKKMLTPFGILEG